MAYRLKNNKWTLITAHHEWPLAELTQSHARAFYLYDIDDALERAEIFLRSPFAVHFAMKSNTCPALLRAFAARGLGVDVVSLGELQKALAHGFPPERVIFSGVAKDREDLETALRLRIQQINVESLEELQLLQEIALEKGIEAPVALRLNIQLIAPTHVHVQTATPDSKFGLDLAQLPAVLQLVRQRRGVRVIGLATHIGSQIVDVAIFRQMAQQMGELYRQLKNEGLPLERLDLGGGLGIDYQSDGSGDLARAEQYLQVLAGSHGTDARILVEPGRFLVARMGVLLAKVIRVKTTSTQKFAILNAGMNALMRPALYDAYHRILPLVARPEIEPYTVVGPICESTDKFATGRTMGRLERGDWVAIFDAGAYGATMANTYNESALPEQWSVCAGQWEVN